MRISEQLRLASQASVAKGATSLYVANAVVLAAGVVYFLVMTNILRSTLDVGIVTALNIMIWLLATVCIFAQPVTAQSPIPAPLAVLKFLPELLAKRSGGGARRVFMTSLMIAAALSGVVAGILIVAPWVVIPLLGGQAVLPGFIQLSALDVFVVSLGQICIGALIALGDMRSATGYIILWSLVRYTLASVLLVYYAVTGVLLGWILGDTVLLVVALQTSVRRIRVGAGGSFPLADLSRYWLYTLFSALIGFGFNQADKIFTLAHQGLNELAVYNIAIVAASFTGLAPYALVMVLVPALSALRASNNAEEIRVMVGIYTRFVSILVIPVAFGFAAITEVILRIFGPVYTNGFLPSVIVSIATGLTAIGAVYAGVLLAFAELRWYTLANVVGLLGLLATSALLTPILGLNGPALGRACLMILAAAVYAIAAGRRGFLELDVGAFLAAIVGSGVMGLIVFFALSLFNSFIVRLAALPVVVVVGLLIYLGWLRLTHLLRTEDLELIRRIIPTRFQGLIPKLARLAGVRMRDS
jgi:O-antigen/teichoic acid export membrane protein